VRRAERRADAGVAANARLTAANAAVLLVLLAAEGVTVLRVRALLMPHVFIGVVLIPPVLLKVASTGWRFARYYSGVPAYRRKGPPPLLLRLLGPVVVILTVVLLASGVGLLLVSPSWLALLLKVHKASFVLWFGAMTIHVLGHLGEVFRLAPRDWPRGWAGWPTAPRARAAGRVSRRRPARPRPARLRPARLRLARPGRTIGRRPSRVRFRPARLSARPATCPSGRQRPLPVRARAIRRS